MRAQLDDLTLSSAARLQSVGDAADRAARAHLAHLQELRAHPLLADRPRPAWAANPSPVSGRRRSGSAAVLLEDEVLLSPCATPKVARGSTTGEGGKGVAATDFSGMARGQRGSL